MTGPAMTESRGQADQRSQKADAMTWTESPRAYCIISNGVIDLATACSIAGDTAGVMERPATTPIASMAIAVRTMGLLMSLFIYPSLYSGRGKIRVAA
jgi:hypothetical protein